jgi:hypothetical protein
MERAAIRKMGIGTRIESWIYFYCPTTDGAITRFNFGGEANI